MSERVGILSTSRTAKPSISTEINFQSCFTGFHRVVNMHKQKLENMNDLEIMNLFTFSETISGPISVQ